VDHTETQGQQGVNGAIGETGKDELHEIGGGTHFLSIKGRGEEDILGNSYNSLDLLKADYH
jgi:hypothetical protein